jgi:hypothetical protein
MVQNRAPRDSLEEIQAQYLVCSHLTRACRQAMFEIALDEADDSSVRRRAVQLLKEILADWSDAQRWLRTDISRRQKATNLTAR